MFGTRVVQDERNTQDRRVVRTIVLVQECSDAKARSRKARSSPQNIKKRMCVPAQGRNTGGGIL